MGAGARPRSLPRSGGRAGAWRRAWAQVVGVQGLSGQLGSELGRVCPDYERTKLSSLRTLNRTLSQSGKRQGPKARRHAARSPERGKERGRAPAALGERPAAHRLLRDSAQAAPVAAEAGETPDVLDGHIDAGCEREVMAAWIFGCVKLPRDRRVLQTRSRSP